MMGFINQCHSVCKAFKLGFQSQNFGQVMAQLTLLEDNPLQPTTKNKTKKKKHSNRFTEILNELVVMEVGGIQTMAALDH